MSAAARRAKEYQECLQELDQYIASVANRTGKKSILFGIEDITQECMVVLWRVLMKYPEARGLDLLKLYRRSLIRHLASLFRLEHVRRSYGTVQFSRLETHPHRNGKGEDSSGGSWVYDGVTGEGVYSREYSVLPWDFYKVELKRIESRIGRKRLQTLLHHRNHGKGYGDRKEEILRSLE